MPISPHLEIGFPSNGVTRMPSIASPVPWRLQTRVQSTEKNCVSSYRRTRLSVMNFRKEIMRGEDPYNIGGYSSSDDGKGDSSDDELTVEELLKGRKRDHDSSDEDEFEKEMDMELENVLRNYQSHNFNPCPGKVKHDSDEKENDKNSNNPQNSTSATQDVHNTYSEDYFSSGSDDEHFVGGQASKCQERRKMLSNDELLYDPDMDDEDEKWVVKQRLKHRRKEMHVVPNKASPADAQEVSSENQNKLKTSNSNVKKKVPTSDAILSCPACMATLCIDCQRHEIYRNQFRAMFVMNCQVSKDEVLRYEPSQPRKFGRKKKGQKGKLVQHTPQKETTSQDQAVSELYHPVSCTECHTEVAVYDSNEVYHFFNVLTSHA